ncbi:hypothetical protein HZB89_00160 [archaeon]|nr:hypothetical protein [archaeon]
MNARAQVSFEVIVSMLLLFAVFAIALADSTLKNNIAKSMQASLDNDNECLKLSGIVSKVALNQGMRAGISLDRNAAIHSGQSISLQGTGEVIICSYLGRANDANLSKGIITASNQSGVVGFE